MKSKPACGNIVVTKLGRIEGMITCVAERFGNCIYEVSYVIGSEFTDVWLREEEFEIKGSKTKKVGY